MVKEHMIKKLGSKD